MYSMYVKDQYIYDVTDSFIECVISVFLVQVHGIEDGHRTNLLIVGEGIFATRGKSMSSVIHSYFAF
jgi:hypothetical protein